MMRYPGYTPPGQAPTVKHVYANEEFKKAAPKCQGCPYGDRQHCVGICWADVYRKKPRVEVTTVTEVKVIE